MDVLPKASYAKNCLLSRLPTLCLRMESNLWEKWLHECMHACRNGTWDWHVRMIETSHLVLLCHAVQSRQGDWQLACAEAAYARDNGQCRSCAVHANAAPQQYEEGRSFKPVYTYACVSLSARTCVKECEKHYVYQGVN